MSAFLETQVVISHLRGKKKENSVVGIPHYTRLLRTVNNGERL